jgi:ATP-dependent exoDNAse (exonuclease V) beta subunit
LVHNLFELVDWEEPEGVEQLAEDEAGALDLPETASAEATKMILKALRSETFQRIVRQDEYHKESPFVIAHGGTLIQGKIDVLVREGSDVSVVDFKTDRISEKEAEAKAEHYRHQGETYARAVKLTNGSPPTETTFLFLSPMIAVEMPEEP